MRIQLFLTVIFAPERDRSGHVSASAVAATQHGADATTFAEVTLKSINHRVVLIELGSKAEFGASLYSTA